MESQALLWEKCVGFHGHACGGLAIGFQAALLAGELLALGFSQDEDAVCVAENDACGVDAVQVLLGCSAGKGNLLFRLRGKQVFTFFNRKTGRGVRLSLRPYPKEVGRGESMAYLLGRPAEELFDCGQPAFPPPEPARIFSSRLCQGCGEKTAENMLRLEDGKTLCLDCCRRYDRFGL